MVSHNLPTDKNRWVVAKIPVRGEQKIDFFFDTMTCSLLLISGAMCIIGIIQYPGNTATSTETSRLLFLIISRAIRGEPSSNYFIVHSEFQISWNNKSCRLLVDIELYKSLVQFSGINARETANCNDVG